MNWRPDAIEVGGGAGIPRVPDSLKLEPLRIPKQS
jgi:hypothetical protein